MISQEWVLAALLYAGCSKNETTNSSDQITGSGRQVSAPRAVGTVIGIRVTSFAKVFIVRDSVDALVIEADDNIIDRVLTSVTDGVLVGRIHFWNGNDHP